MIDPSSGSGSYEWGFRSGYDNDHDAHFQEIDIIDLAPGRYVVVHTVNPGPFARRAHLRKQHVARAASRIARVARGRHRQAAADTLKRVRRGLRPRRPRPCLHRTPYAHLLRQYVVDEPRLHVA